MIRGINVGGHHKVPMAALKDLYGQLGLEDVSTLLNSGNVVCTAGPKLARNLEARLEKAFRDRFQFEAAVVNRTPAQLEKAIAECPFTGPGIEEKKLALVFLKTDPRPELALPQGFTLGPGGQGTAAGGELVRFFGDLVYVYYANGQADTRFTLPVIEKMMGTVGTARGLQTVKKLLARALGAAT